MNILDFVLFFALYFCSISFSLRIMQHKLSWKPILGVSAILTAVPIIATYANDFISNIERIHNPVQLIISVLSILVFSIFVKKVIKCSTKEKKQLTLCWFLVFFHVSINDETCHIACNCKRCTSLSTTVVIKYLE